MEKLILVVHVLTALSIIGLILMQQGKGAEAGASFGSGASQTVFGGEGSGNFFTRATAVLATVFFVTSFGLAVVAKNKSSLGGIEGMPDMAIEEGIPAVVEMSSDVAEGDVPAMTDYSIGSDSTSDIPASE
jgi:preprotein translocase subunit SecG